jgi:hypothetical protein
VQVYKLHENHGAYAAPVLLQELGAVHKEQVFEADKKHGPPPGAAKAPAAPAEARDAPEGPKPTRAPRPERPTPPSQAALKAFFLIVSAALVATTLLGLWMAAKYSRDKAICAACFAAGILAPLATFLLK